VARRSKLVKWKAKAQNLHCLFRETLFEYTPFPEDSRETLRHFLFDMQKMQHQTVNPLLQYRETMLSSSAITTLLGTSKPLIINFAALDIIYIKISATKCLTH
jgi:hypothetical protein